MFIRSGILISEIKNNGNDQIVKVPISVTALSLLELKKEIKKKEEEVEKENKLSPFFNVNTTFRKIEWQEIKEV